MERRNFLKLSSFIGALGIGPIQSGLCADNSVQSGYAAYQTTYPPIETDVLVVGAGAAGIPAAIAAARNGVKVVLIEEDAIVGGAAVDSYVSMLCGWPRIGIFREMVDILQTEHSLTGQVSPQDELKDTWFLPSSFIRVFQKMLAAEPNINVICGARASKVLVADNNRVQGVSIERLAGCYQNITAKVTIDASGCGAVAQMAGCKTMYGRDAKSDFNETHAQDKSDQIVMPCTLMYISQKLGSGPDIDVTKMKNKGLNDSGFGWYGTDPSEFYRRSSGRYLHWGSTVMCEDTRDPMMVGKAQMEAVSKIEDDLRMLSSSGYLVHLAPRIGIRESVRVLGDYVITENYLKSGKFEDDAVAIGQYYLDVWGEKLTEEDKALPKFGIPYRSLIPKDYEGLLVAGKAISGTHVAMSAYRVQPIAAGIGQAAGTAAAIAASAGSKLRDIEFRTLKTKLIQAGIGLDEI